MFRFPLRFGEIKQRKTSSAPVCALGHLPQRGRHICPKNGNLPVWMPGRETGLQHRDKMVRKGYKKQRKSGVAKERKMWYRVSIRNMRYNLQTKETALWNIP